MTKQEIKKLRTRLKLSQVAFASAIYTTQSTVAKFENGTQMPNAAVLAHIKSLASKVSI